MTVVLTWQTVITAGAVIAAVTAIVTLLTKAVHWVDRQRQQDTDIKQLRQQHEDDIKAIRHEQTVIIRGILAALEGLREQGCDGIVTTTISEINEHLNQQAHKK